jgi:hypothetical protein
MAANFFRIYGINRADILNIAVYDVSYADEINGDRLIFILNGGNL